MSGDEDDDGKLSLQPSSSSTSYSSTISLGHQLPDTTMTNECSDGLPLAECPSSNEEIIEWRKQRPSLVICAGEVNINMVPVQSSSTTDSSSDGPCAREMAEVIERQSQQLYQLTMRLSDYKTEIDDVSSHVQRIHSLETQLKLSESRRQKLEREVLALEKVALEFYELKCTIAALSDSLAIESSKKESLKDLLVTLRSRLQTCQFNMMYTDEMLRHFNKRRNAANESVNTKVYADQGTQTTLPVSGMSRQMSNEKQQTDFFVEFSQLLRRERTSKFYTPLSSARGPSVVPPIDTSFVSSARSSLPDIISSRSYNNEVSSYLCNIVPRRNCSTTAVEWRLSSSGGLTMSPEGRSVVDSCDDDGSLPLSRIQTEQQQQQTGGSLPVSGHPQSNSPRTTEALLKRELSKCRQCAEDLRLDSSRKSEMIRHLLRELGGMKRHLADRTASTAVDTPRHSYCSADRRGIVHDDPGVVRQLQQMVEDILLENLCLKSTLSEIVCMYAVKESELRELAEKRISFWKFK